MTLSQIETKMTSLLTKELSIVAEEFEIRFLDNNGSFNITLYTEDNQSQDFDSMKKNNLTISATMCYSSAVLFSFSLEVYLNFEIGPTPEPHLAFLKNRTILSLLLS